MRIQTGHVCARAFTMLALCAASCTGQIDDGLATGGAPMPGGAPAGAETREGTLHLTLVSNEDRTASTPEYFLEVDGGAWLQLVFERHHDLLHALGGGDVDHEHTRLPFGGRVRVTGDLDARGRFEVSGLDVLDAVRDDGAVIQQAAITPTPKRVAVILANFAAAPTQPITPDAARSNVFTSTTSSNAYFKEVSFGARSLVGKVRADGDVFGWYTIANSNTTCDYSAWGTAARAAAQAAGVDLTGYDHIIHYFPRTSSCGWSGVGQVPGRYTWINGSSAQTIAHELGHNFGLHHASSLSCSSGGVRVAVSASCSSSEYGDPWDVMGRGYKHLNVYHKGRAGWLEAANTATVAADGVFTIEPLEQKAAGIQSLRIAIPGTTLFYYLEYRQPIGFDNGSTTSTQARGVLIHRAPQYATMQRPQLIDATPATSSYSDASLTGVTGRTTFADPTMGLTVTVQAASTTGVQVHIDLP